MPEATKLDRGNRKERIGEVISNKMAKTIVVRVQRRFPHPAFKKVVDAATAETAVLFVRKRP